MQSMAINTERFLRSYSDCSAQVNPSFDRGYPKSMAGLKIFIENGSKEYNYTSFN